MNSIKSRRPKRNQEESAPPTHPGDPRSAALPAPAGVSRYARVPIASTQSCSTPPATVTFRFAKSTVATPSFTTPGVSVRVTWTGCVAVLATRMTTPPPSRASTNAPTCTLPAPLEGLDTTVTSGAVDRSESRAGVSSAPSTANRVHSIHRFAEACNYITQPFIRYRFQTERLVSNPVVRRRGLQVNYR